MRRLITKLEGVPDRPRLGARCCPGPRPRVPWSWRTPSIVPCVCCCPLVDGYDCMCIDVCALSQHRHYLLRRHVGHDIVDLLEDESTIGLQDFHTALDVVDHILHRSPGENLLSIAATAPEANVAAEFAFEPAGFHVGSRCLHGLYYVEAGFKESRQKMVDAPTGMEHDLYVGKFFRSTPESRVAREVILTEHAM